MNASIAPSEYSGCAARQASSSRPLPASLQALCLAPRRPASICGLFDDLSHSQRLRCPPACLGLIDGAGAGAVGIRAALSGGQALQFERGQVLGTLDQPDHVCALGPKHLMCRLELAYDRQFAKAAVALGLQVIQPVAPLAIGSFVGLVLAAVSVVGEVNAERRIGRRHRVLEPGLHRAVPLLRRGGERTLDRLTSDLEQAAGPLLNLDAGGDI